MCSFYFQRKETKAQYEEYRVLFHYKKKKKIQNETTPCTTVTAAEYQAECETEGIIYFGQSLEYHSMTMCHFFTIVTVFVSSNMDNTKDTECVMIGYVRLARI